MRTYRSSVATTTRNTLPAGATGKRGGLRGGAVSRRLGGVRGLTVRVTVRATKSSRPAGLEYEDPQLKAQAKSEMWQRKYLLDLSIVAPTPREYQQTLKASFIRRGIGLHSGAPVTVRVRPALAGEGRYFVLVPPGTIQDAPTQFEDDDEIDSEDLEDMKLEFFKMSLLDDEERAARVAHLFPDMDLNVDKPQRSESPVAGKAGEVRIPATLASVVPQPLRLSTRLAVGEHTVATVEHLLSALEASGVDNARVEVEEATELPVLDGSAEGWVLGVRDAGVVKAKDAKGASLPRLVPKPPTHVKVSDGDAFVMFHPEPAPRLTYLVDFKAKSEAIGRQSHTWAPLEDENYAHEVARARTFTTLEDAEAAREAGLVKGGSLSNALVAEGTQFLNGPLRFSNECARHKLLDLVGDLSLLGVNGNGGLPEGHVVAYKAGHQLHVQFARALAEACGAEDYVPTVCAPLVVQPKVEADAEDDASLN